MVTGRYIKGKKWRGLASENIRAVLLTILHNVL
jgi:hypothetical protein